MPGVFDDLIPSAATREVLRLQQPGRFDDLIPEPAPRSPETPFATEDSALVQQILSNAATVVPPVVFTPEEEQALAESRGMRQPTLRERFQMSPVGRKLFGASPAEREGLAEMGFSPPVTPYDIAGTMLKFTSPPPPIAEPIRWASDKFFDLIPNTTARGISKGARDFVLSLPLAAPAGKVVMAAFAGDVLWHLPEQKRAFDEARAQGDDEAAARIATQAVTMGGLMVLGAGHEAVREIRTSRAMLGEPTPRESPSPQEIALERSLPSPGRFDDLIPETAPPKPVPEPSATLVPEAAPEVAAPVISPSVREPTAISSAPSSPAAETITGPQVTPAEEGIASAMPAEREKRPKPVASSSLSERPPDVIDQLEGHVGKIDPKLIREANPDWKPVGAARKLFRHGGIPADRALNGITYGGPVFGLGQDTPLDQFGDAINAAALSRQQWIRQNAKQDARIREESKQLEQFERRVLYGERPKAQAENVEQVRVDNLVEGDTFKVQDHEFVVRKLEFDEDGNVINLMVKDGPKFGVQTINPGAVELIHIDKGTFQPIPREAWPEPQAVPEHLQLAPPESIAEQQARLEIESKAAQERSAAQTMADREATAKRKMLERAAAPLGGDLGSAGQGGLFVEPGQQEIFKSNAAQAAAVQFPSPEGQQLGIAAPLPFTRSTLAAIHRGAAGLGDVIKTIAGQSMPRITRADRPAGELGVRYAASRIAAPYAARSFVNEVLGGLGVDPVRFGAALTEDNLRSVKAGFIVQGDMDSALQVKTLIGSRNSPFRTEQQYQNFLNRPATQAALARHRDAWEAHIAPQYKAAMRLDDSLTLPTRGQQTGARINLYGIREADRLERPRHIISAQSPNLTATFRRKSPFGRRATGASEEYAVDYHDIMANTFGRQLEIANKNKFDAALVAGGNAVIGPPGEKPVLHGEETVSFPLQRTLIVERSSEGQTKSVPASANIYVRKSLAREYELAANLYRNRFAESARVLTGAFNRAAMAGLTDATVHLSNLGTVLFTRPMTGVRNPIGDILMRAMGGADIPIIILRGIGRSMRDNSKQLAELAEIGVLRPDQPTWNPASKAIHWADKTTRLILDDTFKEMADRGLVDNTETSRREFINQAGQYNKRLQGVLTHALRESGIGPFITAGKAFNTLAVRNLLMDPGVKTTSPQAWLTLRAGVAARWVGAIALIGAINYLLTKDKGGGVAGRPGTPLGRIDTGRDNEAGRPLTVPALDLFGLGRPLRVTGLRGFVESKRLGLDTQAAIDAAARDVVNSWTGPILGPPVRFGVGAATGYSPAMGVGRIHPVVPPGESQSASDLANAVYESNPILATARESGALAAHLPWMPYADQLPPKPTSDVIARQIPRFMLLPGKPAEMIERYPEIVQRAKSNAFLDDVIHRARTMGREQRTTFLQESIAKLPPEEQQHAWQEVKRRRVLLLPAAAQGKE